MRYPARGAQRASSTGREVRYPSTSALPALVSAIQPTPSTSRSSLLRAVAALWLAALIAAIGMTALTAPRALAAATSAEGMKAVIIVGPASGSTSEYLREGERIARQAEAEGMDVRRIFTPRATWARVKANIQGANLVVYLGHGNGWPSNLGPFRPESKDGLGLNRCDGTCGTSGPTKYFGEDFIRKDVRLAQNAVVLLHRLCYASGNAESGMAPVFNKDLATERASNFASGFLDAGAAVVFALGWKQNFNLPGQLATSDKTMDEIFMNRASDPRYYDGFVGEDDYYRASTRNADARVHLDPHPRFGHLRAVTGRLDLTANEWRGTPPPPDETAPTLRVKSTAAGDRTLPAGSDDTIVFSPNGDGTADRVVIDRILSEPAWIDIDVRNADGQRVRSVTRYDGPGDGQTTWDGRNDQDRVVKDGRYEIQMTPRDRAGNVGDTKVVAVRVLTVLGRLRASAPRIHASDGDALSAGVTLSATLDRDAKVTWTIRRGGEVVRMRYDAEPMAAGKLEWRWDGKDDKGDYVPDGEYQAVLVASTPEGTMGSSVEVGVGQWQMRLDDRTPRRGDKVTLTVRSTEMLPKPPTVTVLQTGLLDHPQVLRMKAKDSHTFTITVKLARKGPAGAVKFVVSGTDKAGGTESGKLKLKLR